MALTAAAVHSYVFMTRISRPMVSRGNACFASTNTSSVQSTQPPSIAATHHLNHTARPLENFSPDIWGDRFAALPFTNSELEWYSRKVEDLKVMVKDMLMNSVDDPIENILLINSACRLGVSYHFETEIEEQLSHLYIALDQLMDYGYDLHVVAVIFQVFRSYGYKIPCGT
ncbi:hypothetical protein V6N11_026551 [Hibiscus sabdariffa]|uniref:Terpene synthase N-terminal domain-containing protein n=1 Tax=Hibiscus sabdariffa TaxID=183260 RepID=A0ABR2SWU4_9ROSI